VNVPGERFCGECGAPLAGEAAAPRAAAAAASPGTTAQERRLVSVLFADLVGFTTLSEHRDPEEVRDLLSRYFDRCRSLIERYGGTVEKFIGDAVMAVWGTPVAREDDAERAVRAALGLTQAVAALADEVGMPELRVRAGVLTGNAAVEVGAEGEGMVLGDTVNTASRLQSIAAPGTVLVDDVTRRASEAAIAYEDAGSHQVKGREQPVRAWTALRVVAGAGGARRSAGLEAPLVGRTRELELIIESFEDSADAGRARLMTIAGEAGSGKSRLLWEFFKYIDGVERVVRWHQGRCLSYGEGVAYWALAEMVRSRAGILEEEDPRSARQKLAATVAEHVPDERERRLVEPRLAHLLGFEQRSAADRADLFSGWRLFFERIAQTEPVVLAFEDLQWADLGLLDFIDYLLEWSAELPIFILALGRPEMLRARPAWSATISLGPLDDDSMARLLAGLVPGLPDELVAQIRRRAEGVPLYAVETVRMLLDRGLLAQDGSRYVVTGDVSDLAVPETLQALVASRMDNLDVAERSLLQDAAVIGQSFTPATLAAVSGRAPAEISRVLDSLVSKQVLSYVDDPRSPEVGQYVFLQALLHSVALSTLSRRDRKSRHLAVARHLRETWGEEAGEIADVLATHYLDAVEADPDAPDVPELRAAAAQTLEEAGRRALSLAAGPEARRHFERAAELAEDPAARGRLIRDAGLAAQQNGEMEDAVELLDTAVALLREAGMGRDAAHAEGLAGGVVGEIGRWDEATDRLAKAFAAVEQGGDEIAIADLAARLSNVAFMGGDRARALELADRSLTIADSHRLGEILVMAMLTKANSLAELGRPVESTALMTSALKLAIEQDMGAASGRAYYNLAENIMAEGRYAEAQELLDEGLELARRRGDRQIERRLLAQTLVPQVALGQWDEALELARNLREQADDVWSVQTVVYLPAVLSARGETEGLRDLLDGLTGTHGWAVAAAAARIGEAILLRETGDAQGSVPKALAVRELLEIGESSSSLLFAEAVQCAFAAERLDVVRELLERVDGLRPSQLLPPLEAEAARTRARVAAQEHELEAAGQWFRRAIGRFRELAMPFALARAQLEYAELLGSLPGREDEAAALLDEAREVFEGLRAEPWLERAAELTGRVAA
jgi:class 3 adenylate cyclase/tetratricopeptide (TPR) repeat protein